MNEILEALPADIDELFFTRDRHKHIYSKTRRWKVNTKFYKKQKLFLSHKMDEKSVLFSEEKLNLKLFKKLQKPTYVKDKKLLKLINVAENSIEEFNKNDKKIPIRLDYAEKREIDRSTIYSFNGHFQLMHADIANLDCLGKSATIPKYALLIADLFSSKVYVYPMQSRKQVLKYLNIFYVEIKNKRNMRRM